MNGLEAQTSGVARATPWLLLSRILADGALRKDRVIEQVEEFGAKLQVGVVSTQRVGQFLRASRIDWPGKPRVWCRIDKQHTALQQEGAPCT
jgi:hypothetical protein